MSRRVEIKLSYPFLYEWKHEGNVSLLSNSGAPELFKKLSGISSVDSAGEILNQTDGNFAVVINASDFLFAAVDHVRSFPLMYKVDKNGFCFTDNIQGLEKRFVFNKAAEQVFVNIFCCEGQTTLLENWKQLHPGEFLLYDKKNDRLNVQRYFNFEQRTSSNKIDHPMLKDIYLKTFQKIINEAGDKSLIVPLSGGYDSRCILACLQMLGAKNIFCYTYGRNDSPEKAIAEKVAKQLNLNWHFVEYDEKLLDIFFTEKWQAYSDKNHHFTSLPHEQDFFALYTLQQKGLLPKDGIVLPGFLGDYFAGSMFKNTTIQNISQYQDGYISNRGCKFILNSVRVYEYFGLEWRVPFTDKNILEYWLGIPLQERLYENGYNDAMSEVFFEPLQINFKKTDHIYESKPLKELLRSVLPESVIHFVQANNSQKPENDPNNTFYLWQKIMESQNENIKNVKFDFNGAHARYFLKRLAQKNATLEYNSDL